MAQIETNFYLPPGPLPIDVAERLVRLVVQEYAWVTPKRLGRSEADSPIVGDDLLAAAVTFFEEEGSLCLAGPGGELLLNPDRPGQRNTSGFFVWFTDSRKAKKSDWRSSHLQQCGNVARLLSSPVGYSSLSEDYEAKAVRLVPGGDFTEEVQRLRGYHEGLLGLFWRNFFGPPFGALMADRLAALGPPSAHDLGSGYWQLETYERPEEALTEAGIRREKELIAHLGADLFYDTTTETPPARAPRIDGLDVAD